MQPRFTAPPTFLPRQALYEQRAKVLGQQHQQVSALGGAQPSAIAPILLGAQPEAAPFLLPSHYQPLTGMLSPMPSTMTSGSLDELSPPPSIPNFDEAAGSALLQQSGDNGFASASVATVSEVSQNSADADAEDRAHHPDAELPPYPNRGTTQKNSNGGSSLLVEVETFAELQKLADRAEADLKELKDACQAQLLAMQSQVNKHDRQLLHLPNDASVKVRGSQRLQNDVAECEAHVNQLNGLSEQQDSFTNLHQNLSALAHHIEEMREQCETSRRVLFSSCERWLQNMRARIDSAAQESTTMATAIGAQCQERLESLRREKHDAALRTIERIHTMRVRVSTVGKQRGTEASGLQEQLREMDDYDPRVESNERRLKEIDSELLVLRSNYERLGELQQAAKRLIKAEESQTMQAILDSERQRSEQQDVDNVVVAPPQSRPTGAGGRVSAARLSTKRPRPEPLYIIDDEGNAQPSNARTGSATNGEQISEARVPLGSRMSYNQLQVDLREKNRSTGGFFNTVLKVFRRAVYDDGEVTGGGGSMSSAFEDEAPPLRRRRLE